MIGDLARRLTEAMRTGHRWWPDLRYVPAGDVNACACERCRQCDALMADVLAPATRAEVERLVGKVREYRDNLTATFDAACRRRTAEEGARAGAACGGLSDDLGITLVDQVRRMTIRSYGDHHGACDWRAAGEGWWQQITSASE